MSIYKSSALLFYNIIFIIVQQLLFVCNKKHYAILISDALLPFILMLGA